MGKLCVHTGCAYSCPWVLNSLRIEIQPLTTSVFRVPDATADCNDRTEAQTPASCYCKKDDATLASPSLKGVGWVGA